MAIKDLAKWGKRKAGEMGNVVEPPLSILQRRMNRLFDDFFTGFDLEPFSGWSERFSSFNPKITLREDEKRFLVEAELPGMEEKDIDISLTKDALTIRGEKREERESSEGEHQHYSERTYGAFQRLIPLQFGIDEDKVDASFVKGVLRIELPKTKAAQSQAKKNLCSHLNGFWSAGVFCFVIKI